jgi:hypothetical protein
MDKKRPAKIIMQQRKNFADAKSKLVDHVKENYVEPLKGDPNEVKEPRAKLGSFEGKVSTFLGIAPSQTENRNDALAQGLQDGSRHVPTYLAGAADKYPEGVAHISDGLSIKAKRPGGNNE